MNRFRILVLALSGLALLVARADAADVEIATASVQVDLEALKKQFARPADTPFPAHNPFSEEKRLLGQALFFDPRLSQSGATSCASCHNPALGWQDGLARGRGDKGNKLARHTPTILNVAWAPALFWDGRAETLEDQAKGPMLSPNEMAMTEETLIGRVKATRGYQPMFAAAFPGREADLRTIVEAIATFERTAVSELSPFDRWVEGDDDAIGDSAKRGFQMFNGKANCAACHTGWRLTDDGFHDIGLRSRDLGRGKLVSDVPELQYAFKTPTLRNAARRAPYMHDGSLATLEAVIRHYEKDFRKRPSLSVDMRTYELTAQERADLIAFLDTLSSDDKPAVVPTLAR